MQGNECANEGAVRGSAQAFQEVFRDREVRDIWHDPGPEQMDSDSDDKLGVGSRVSAFSDAEPCSADSGCQSQTIDTSQESLAVPSSK